MKYIKGDLLQLAKEGEFDVIIHGCNCFHTMGGGIALQIKQQFPGAYVTDCQTTKYGDRSKLGSWSAYYVPRYDFYILNAYTQFGYGIAKRHTDYDAIRNIFHTLSFAGKGGHIGYPAIGCGLGGGDWGIIRDIINEELQGLDHTLVDYTGEFNEM